MEDKVKSAVWEFAHSINSGSKVDADMSALIDATPLPSGETNPEPRKE